MAELALDAGDDEDDDEDEDEDGDEEVDGDAVVRGDALADVAEAAAPPADGVPAVGAAQATVKTAVDRSAAAAMPWRKFTSNTFENGPAGRAMCGGNAGSDPARASVVLTGRRTRAASNRLRTFRKE